LVDRVLAPDASATEAPRRAAPGSISNTVSAKTARHIFRRWMPGDVFE
jgi:hypothetical protein